MKRFKTLKALYIAVANGLVNNEIVYIENKDRLVEVRNRCWKPPFGSECRKVWDAAYLAFAAGITDRKVIVKDCVAQGLNRGNVGLELRACFAYYGLEWS